MVFSSGFYYDLSEEEYHADPCVKPSLSSSLSKVIINQSLAHAKLKHPKLTQQEDIIERPERKMEIGSVAHMMILGQPLENIVRIDANDYKKVAAREERENAYINGSQPILEPDFDAASSIAIAFLEQISNSDASSFLYHENKAEVTAIVQDATGALLRARFDKLEDNGTSAIIWDVKTGEQTAAPWTLGRRISNMEYEIQAAFYIRVLSQLRPELAGRIKFRWCFIENEPPHILQVAELDSTGLSVGAKKVSTAIRLWNHAIKTDEWPGYPSGIIRAEYPPFAETKWLSREENDEAIHKLPHDPYLTVSVIPRQNLELIGA